MYFIMSSDFVLFLGNLMNKIIYFIPMGIVLYKNPIINLAIDNFGMIFFRQWVLLRICSFFSIESLVIQLIFLYILYNLWLAYV